MEIIYVADILSMGAVGVLMAIATAEGCGVLDDILVKVSKRTFTTYSVE
jgi:hypothetical protein